MPALERVYCCDSPEISGNFWPDSKWPERIVSFYDYNACGISVLAHVVRSGSPRARHLMSRILCAADHYRQYIYGREIEGCQWMTPLRRLLLHLALAYETAGDAFSPEEHSAVEKLVVSQVPLAIACNHNFWPGITNLYLVGADNHAAIFMQGIYHCGRVFGRREWMATALEFAERLYASGHPDGYFEEHTNAEREGGPSLIYTRLTAGCLYDVLRGWDQSRQKFLRAGELFRRFTNERFEMIPMVDERTNSVSRMSYGIALHSLTAEGRGWIVRLLDGADISTMTPEMLAVLYNELSLMREGDCAVPENLTEGASRLTLPAGILRRNGFTAGLSALRSLNREIEPGNDYALDHQNMLYLSHVGRGVLLTGVKSKNDPTYSTFRIGDDAYPVRTGKLVLDDDHAEAELYYRTFTARIRWDIGEIARLTLEADTDRMITTAFTVGQNVMPRLSHPAEECWLKGFSPYSSGNRDSEIRALVVNWRKSMTAEFGVFG